MNRSLAAALGSLALVALAAPLGHAHAEDPPADPNATVSTEATTTTLPVTVATTSTTIPLFGVPLTVDVSTGAGGAVTSVALNPADAYTAVALKPNKVVFVSDDGQSKVAVFSRHGRQVVAAKATDLASILGPATWSGDVFGTGAPTLISYDVVDAGDGTPNLANVASSDPSAVVGTVEQWDKKDRSGAHVEVTFTNGQRTRSVGIAAWTRTKDGETKAVLAVMLGRQHSVEVPIADGAGVHTWNGVLCDGTAATASFTVAADGSVSAITATPTPLEVRGDDGDNKAAIVFANHEKLVIGTKIDESAGTIRVIMAPRLRCEWAQPQVNTETSLPADDGKHDGKHDDHDGTDSHDGSGWRGTHHRHDEGTDD